MTTSWHDPRPSSRSFSSRPSSLSASICVHVKPFFMVVSIYLFLVLVVVVAVGVDANAVVTWTPLPTRTTMVGPAACLEFPSSEVSVSAPKNMARTRTRTITRTRERLTTGTGALVVPSGASGRTRAPASASASATAKDYARCCADAARYASTRTPRLPSAFVCCNDGGGGRFRRRLGHARPRSPLLLMSVVSDPNGDEKLCSRNTERGESNRKKRVVVVGGGWAGFSAADALSDGRNDNVDIVLLDASPRGRGGLAGGWRTAGGRPVEAGMHGFWREYRNTFAAMEGIPGVVLDSVLTPYTPSALISSSGRVALAPVLGPAATAHEASHTATTTTKTANKAGSDKKPSGPTFPSPPFLSSIPSSLFSADALASIAPLLPPPLDVALLSRFEPTSPLTATDRLSALGLLGPWSDFVQNERESWLRYDSVSAESLFKTYAGVTPVLYDELVSPLLHVLPMAPGYDLSAAAALSCFHVFALQSRGAFDVRWCRGSIAEKIFDPWTDKLLGKGNVDIWGGARVQEIARLVPSTQNGTNVKGYALEVRLDDPAQKPKESNVAKDDSTKAPKENINDNDSDGGKKEESDVRARARPATIQCDAVILAVGCTAASRIASQSTSTFSTVPIAQTFSDLRGVTCVAVRLFLRPSNVVTAGLSGGMYGSTRLAPEAALAMKESPVVVCGPKMANIPQLEETGFCIYDLQRLHDEFAVTNEDTTDSDGRGDGATEGTATAALEVDFYRADDIADMKSDMDVAMLALRAVTAALGLRKEKGKPSFSSSSSSSSSLSSSSTSTSTSSFWSREDVLDMAVVRARNAVSHFDVNSASRSPSGVRLVRNDGSGSGSGLYICGDWIDRTGHASWSTEKSVVTGRQAAAAVASDLGLDVCADEVDDDGVTAASALVSGVVLPTPPDTEQLAALRSIARTLRAVAPPPGGGIPLSPWKFVESLFSRSS